MPPVKQLHGTQVTNYLGGSRIVVVYKISGLATGDDDSWQLELLAKGEPHPLSQGSGALYPGALCRGHQLIRRINPTTVLGAEVFASNLAFHGGPRGGAISTSHEADHTIPIYKKFDDVWILVERLPIERAVFTRSEERFLNGNQVSEIQEAIAFNLGRYYNLNALGSDRWYKLGPHQNIAFDGISRTRVIYAFTLLCAFPEIPAPSIFGNEIAIPALPEQHRLNDYIDPATGVPVIEAVPVDAFALTGAPLPGLFP